MNMGNLFYLSELTDKGLVSREVLEQELLDYAYILLREYEVMEDREDAEEESPLRILFKKFYPEN